MLVWVARVESLAGMVVEGWVLTVEMDITMGRLRR